jgi:hypothetical protein
MKTRWADRPVTVDGDDKDWLSVPTAYLKDSAVQLGLRNDNDNLYLLLSSVDPRWALAVRFGNLTLWIDTTGEAEEERGIRFRGGVPVSEVFEQLASERGELEPGGERSRAVFEDLESSLAELSVIAGDTETSIAVDGSDGPAASFGRSRASFAFEFGIPLKADEDDLFAVGAGPGDPITVGIEWGDIDKDALEEARDRMSERMSELDEARNEDFRGPPGERATIFTSQGKVWVTTTLASP